MSDQPLTENRKRFSVKGDWAHWGVLYGASGLFALICAVFIISIVVSSIPAWRHSGLSIIYGRVWSQGTQLFGALPIITGTLGDDGHRAVLRHPDRRRVRPRHRACDTRPPADIPVVTCRAPGGSPERRLRALGPARDRSLVRKDPGAGPGEDHG